MGRAGSGGGGGHRSSGHSSGHSTSGHRIGGGSRAGSGRSSFGGSGSRSGSFGGFGSRRPSAPFTPPPNRNTYGSKRYTSGPSVHYAPPVAYNPNSGYPEQHSGCGCAVSSISVLVIVCVIAAVFAIAALNLTPVSDSDTAKSTVKREAIQAGAFDSNCIIDEIGWFDNISKTGTRLKSFWQQTGVQPVIILKSYDPELTTDAQKEDWATEYYDSNISREDVFLYVYFAERNQDDDVGYMTVTPGAQVGIVMDSEAEDIFWSYIDSYWYSNMSTDDVFVTVFNKTAEKIMAKPTNGYDVLKVFIILLCIIAGGAAIIIIMKKRRDHAREKAEETERILKAGQNQKLYEDEEINDLADKYSDNSD